MKSPWKKKKTKEILFLVGIYKCALCRVNSAKSLVNRRVRRWNFKPFIQLNIAESVKCTIFFISSKATLEFCESNTIVFALIGFRIQIYN